MRNIFDISKIDRISFRDDINGIRGISVLGVVLYHADIVFFKGGWIGVDVFFVISGYLISNIVISEMNQKKFSFRNFYIRRIKRILPALFSTLLFTIPFAFILLTPIFMLEYTKSLFSSLFFYSNYFFQGLDFYNSEPTKYMPLMHTWSLAIEEQFYIIFPVIALIFYKLFRKYFFWIIISISIISFSLNIFDVGIQKFYQLQFRMWELFLGMIVMILGQNLKIKNLEIIGIIFMLFPFYYFDDSWINDIEPKIIALFGIGLILLSNRNDSYLSKILRFKLLSIVGLSSFSIYLLHQPIFAFAKVYWRGRLYQYNNFDTFTLIGLTLLLGYLSYIFVEKKFIQYKNYHIVLIFVGIAIVLFSNYSNSTNGVSTRFSENYNYLEKYYSYTAQREIVDRDLCNQSKKYKDFKSFCNLNYKEGNKNLLIIGDSHQEVLAKYFLDKINKNEINLFISIYQGCPFVVELVNNGSRANCGNLEKESEILEILAEDNSYLIYGGRFPWYFNGKAFETNLGTIGDDTSSGKEKIIDGLYENINFFVENVEQIFLLYPIPELGYYPLEPHLYGYYEIDEEITYDYKYWKEYSLEINNFLDSLPETKITKIYSHEYFCDSFFMNSCTSSYNGIFFYYDDDHLTRDGVELISKDIFNALS